MDELNIKNLTGSAISSLKHAYEGSTNERTRRYIAEAYTAITLLKFTCVSGNRSEVEAPEEQCDPSEYCSAI